MLITVMFIPFFYIFGHVYVFFVCFFYHFMSLNCIVFFKKCFKEGICLLDNNLSCGGSGITTNIHGWT